MRYSKTSFCAEHWATHDTYIPSLIMTINKYSIENGKEKKTLRSRRLPYSVKKIQKERKDRKISTFLSKVEVNFSSNSFELALAPKSVVILHSSRPDCFFISMTANYFSTVLLSSLRNLTVLLSFQPDQRILTMVGIRDAPEKDF